MEPITRRETLLTQIANNTSGNTGSINMEPITREETYLKQIADNTASGGGGGADLPSDPSTDGVYSLVNTVSSGSGTLAWGAGDIIVVHDNETLDKTWQEIHDYLVAGKMVIAVFNEELEVVQNIFTGALHNQMGYHLFAIGTDGTGSAIAVQYTATAADDYPAFV